MTSDEATHADFHAMAECGAKIVFPNYESYLRFLEKHNEISKQWLGAWHTPTNERTMISHHGMQMEVIQNGESIPAHFTERFPMPTPPYQMKPDEILFYGCSKNIDGQQESGHYPHARRHDGSLEQLSLRALDHLSPHFEKGKLDGGFCPSVDFPFDGKVTRIPGFTVLAFWDRTGDSRPGSSSTFILAGYHRAGLVELACRTYFYKIFARIAPHEIKIVEVLDLTGKDE